MMAHLDTVHALKLVYTPEPKTQTLKESITFLASEYLASLGVYCVQTSASVLCLNRIGIAA